MRHRYSSMLDLSYRHLPVLEQTPSDLLVPTDLDVGSLLKQEHVSGAKSLTHTPALAALAGMSFVHKRHAETGLLAPHWLGGGAACGEGVLLVPSIIAPSKKPPQNGVFKDMNIWVAFEDSVLARLGWHSLETQNIGKEEIRSGIENIFTHNGLEVSVEIIHIGNLCDQEGENDFTLLYMCEGLSSANGISNIANGSGRHPTDFNARDIDGSCFVFYSTLEHTFDAYSFSMKKRVAKMINTGCHELYHVLTYRVHRMFSKDVIKRNGYSVLSAIYCNHDDSDTMESYIDIIIYNGHIEYTFFEDGATTQQKYFMIKKYRPDLLKYLPPITTYKTDDDWVKGRVLDEAFDAKKVPSLRLALLQHYAFVDNFTEEITSRDDRENKAWFDFFHIQKESVWSKIWHNQEDADNPSYPNIEKINKFHPIDQSYIKQWKYYHLKQGME